MQTKKEAASKYVDFDVIQEQWSSYELEDDSILRLKVVLTTIEDEPLEDKKGGKLALGVQLLTSVYSPFPRKQEKGKVWSIKELEKAISKPNVKFRILKDGGPAIYMANNKRIIIRHIVKKIDKTSKFDKFGNPSYIVRSENEMLVEAGKSPIEATSIEATTA